MSNKQPQGGIHSGRVADGRKPPLVSSHHVARAVALLLVRHQIRNLRRWFEEFDRDILLPILLGEIALHNIGVFENSHEPALLADLFAERPLAPGSLSEGCGFRPCNAYSIAAATDLPRETVRRKIVRLVELGWVTRRDNGHLFITEAAIEHFGSLLNSRDLVELIEAADRVRRLVPEYDGLQEAG